MWTILLIIFVICLIHDHVEEGGSFVFFSRFVEFSNSFRQPTPRKVRITRGTMELDFLFGKRLYTQIILLPAEPLKWFKVGTHLDGTWVDITKDIEVVAGPGKDFGGVPLKPENINDDYTILGFAYSEEKVIYVKKGEVILAKLLEEAARK